MLNLEDPTWSTLEHAYGSATDIPPMLAQLSENGQPSHNQAIWFDIWSALAHQGDVHSASFAAVPHIVEALALAPEKAGSDYFQFPAWVEICRRKQGAVVPPNLEVAYRAALARMPSLVALGATADWDEGMVRCALAAIAAAKGQHQIAEAVLELSPDIAGVFLERLDEGDFEAEQ